MKYLSLLFMATAAACGRLYAQETLSYSSFLPSYVGTTDVYSNVAVSSLPAQDTGSNKVWDMTAVTLTTLDSSVFSGLPPAAVIPSAHFVRKLIDSIGFYHIYSQAADGMVSTGYAQFGAYLVSHIIPMVPYTMYAADTLTIPSQDVVFSRALRHIAFPATYGTTWSDTVSGTIHASVKLPALGFLNTPADFRITYMNYDTVIGWGTMKIKNDAGQEAHLPVLQVKCRTRRIDSTFINGTVITTPQKDYSGLPNGWMTEQYSYKYYTAGYITPVATVYYNYRYTIPSRAMVLNKPFPPSSVPTYSAGQAPVIYPNPVTGDHVYINTPASYGLTYQLSDVAGKLMHQGGALPAGNVSVLAIPHHLPAGVYIVRTLTAEGSAGAYTINLER